ncbi:MAG: DNA-3-methyladenine glycosylase [Candidatus Yanofskybacteria bacterium]|nr:DNA-3-methyladenine glycosylase [Candidatus Yanofskybacteria bacterium]
MFMTLPQNFFNRPTLIVAKELLGKYIVRKIGKKEMALMITEVEAYDGLKDKASHASRGKTERNQVMFGEAGYFYVYFTYGMHWMLNVVTGLKNYPAAVLVRGTKEILGPARLTKFLKIDKKLNGKKAEPKTGLWFEDRGVKISDKQISRTPRVGVVYAGLIWSKKKYRFLLK